jgi:hypothetical protein
MLALGPAAGIAAIQRLVRARIHVRAPRIASDAAGQPR